MLYIYDKQLSPHIIQENFELFDKGDFEKLFKNIVAMADEYYLENNLWQSMIVYFLVHNENSFTLALERKQDISDSLKQLTLLDLEKIYSMYTFKMKTLEPALYNLLVNYKSSKKVINKEIHNILLDLQLQLSNCKSHIEFYNILKEHYYLYGVGKYGLNKAFRYIDTEISPIVHIGNDSLEDLVGIEYQSKLLCDNTEAFLVGKSANNVLLYGDSGTGKSTSIKALLNKYYKDGLRMVEVYKHQFIDLPRIIQELQSRDYKFIIFMDDLSFEEFEIEYKYLKAVIEGGLEKKPDNILIYATSNRRHLIKQTWSARQGDDVHVNDTKQETISLSTRFGLSILYGKPDKKQYLEIIEVLASCKNITMDLSKIKELSLTWAIRHGGYSGRVAIQFIQSLAINQ